MTTSNGRVRTRLSPKQRKEQLLNCALSAFSRRGIARAGHADIADVANVSVATVFNYFPTRDELVDAVLAEAEREFTAILSNSVSEEPNSLRAALNRVTAEVIDAALDEQDWLKIWFEWSTSIRENIWPQFAKTNQKFIDKLAEQFQAGLARNELNTEHSPADLANMVNGVIYMLYLQANQHADKEQLTGKAQSYINVLLEA
ncbi:LuxR family transcriptional regulator [Veronia nyctiphanis]|uniref:LuxR family transcriptional regulator n=1 Tax=Veronia nyctiphanis TaxID=1278244 RepID=A0A4V1LSP9_9GAMM|nr:TetR/AcrR family transcriptional regulator [Veronia nyctiphanis]RXJ72458.1 LuxR family transcriptional regulator [Veronia nyctiphanis]